MFTRSLQFKLVQLATKYPFVTITGPRQSGKSTLAELTFPDYRRVSLEDLDNREFATEDLRGFIATYPDKTIIDEVQHAYEIKSGATFSKEFFKRLDYRAKLSGAGADRKTVIYGGDRSMTASGGNVPPWHDLFR